MRLPTNNAAAPVLSVAGLSFAYPLRPMFERWSATFASGLHLVCGADGCGKTTLLRLLAADLLAQAGDIRLGRFALADDAHSYRQQLFLTHPTSDLFDDMTPLHWFEGLRSAHSGFDMARAEKLLVQLFLQEHLHKTGHMLSTGSRRKVWLAAALASGADLLLIDQPFAALDAPSIRAVAGLLQQAGQAADRIVVVADYEAPAGLTFTGIHALA